METLMICISSMVLVTNLLSQHFQILTLIMTIRLLLVLLLVQVSVLFCGMLLSLLLLKSLSMCFNPISIRNPKFNRSAYAWQGDELILLPNELSSQEEYISVPCCVCAECRHTYYSSILQRGIVESLSSYMFFVTLTYDNNHLPSLVLPNGELIYYTNYDHVKNMLKRFRNHDVLGREFRYLTAVEFGDESHRPHVHLLLFVARHSDDTPSTPYFIERQIFDNLGNFWAVNVGTRKHPVYEKLFTYAVKFTSKGMISNYYVKYVVPDQPDYVTNTTDNTTFVKTIRYLLGYVNKGSSYDEQILRYLDKIHDSNLRVRLGRLLRSKVRFSKGFGLGFELGCKVSFRRTYVRTSYVNAIYHDNYEVEVEDAQFVLRLLYSNPMSSQHEFIQSLNDKHLYVYMWLIKKFPNFSTYAYKKYWRKPFQSDCISYFYEFIRPYKYVRPQVILNPYEDIPSVYEYIRQGVENGIMNRVPYLCFTVVSDNRYIGLCKFYKERFTTPYDTLRMYESIGVRNYDEWLSKFYNYLDTRMSAMQNANILTHEVELLQKNCESQAPFYDLYSLLY